MALGDDLVEETLYKGKPAIAGSVWRWLIWVLTLGLGYLWFWLRDGQTEYLITNQRVVVERGLFNRKIDTVELYRIEDIEIEKPFAQRLVGTGNITLVTSDRLQPNLELKRLPLDVRELYEKLRPCIQSAKLRFRPEIMGQ
ncbi:MAG: PH domain-containing protein [Pseudanabaenaceae cyanobacterium]